MTTDTYLANGDEVRLFEQAFRRRIPVMLTGPTGCGKTRLVEHIGLLLGRPDVTISCHDDLTSSDLVGRFMVTGGDVVWTDGPLTRAVKAGAISYLDEVVEARHDSLAMLHSLTDHRRALDLDRAGEVVKAPERFMLVCSYNPAYRSSLKELKPSFRQRFVTLPMKYCRPTARPRWSSQKRASRSQPRSASCSARSRSALPTMRSTSSRRRPGCWLRPHS
jgi:nitric oxide reductase NorQ protein